MTELYRVYFSTSEYVYNSDKSGRSLKQNQRYNTFETKDAILLKIKKYYTLKT